MTAGPAADSPRRALARPLAITAPPDQPKYAAGIGYQSFEDIGKAFMPADIFRTAVTRRTDGVAGYSSVSPIQAAS
ncbi:hypothetical protein [Amycolatopsis minnesotensis]|uniref:Uncharacterized protein n=1 Tax=Amycolatopsis minnesotensis TaxID=337894 RepID=A0ABP5C5R4_9PSEU